MRLIPPDDYAGLNDAQFVYVDYFFERFRRLRERANTGLRVREALAW